MGYVKLAPQPEHIKGHARLNVTDELVQLSGIEIQKPLAGRVVWNWMEVQGLVDTFQSFLLLPDSYKIIAVFFDIGFHWWTLIVESDAIPLPKQDEMLPRLNPKYQVDYEKDGTRKVSLIDMQLMN